MANSGNQKLAVMIDADNAQASICSELLSEIAKFGVASVKRAYGDWTTTHLKGWKDYLHKHAIQPIQQFSYTTGKNSTDSSLIIDAMDLLHEGRLDGFCLISSDSDFTRLATRIREAGLTVYGFGEKKTPEAFVSACDKFVFIEVLRPQSVSSAPNESEKTALKSIMVSAIDAVSKDDDWAPLSAVGAYLNKKYPSFDSRNYGFEKLGKLVESLSFIEIDRRKSDKDSSIVHIYIKANNV